jgi:hypothetical protein
MRQQKNIPSDLEDTEDEIFQFFANTYGEYIDNALTTYEDGRDQPTQTERKTTEVR